MKRDNMSMSALIKEFEDRQRAHLEYMATCNKLLDDTRNLLDSYHRSRPGRLEIDQGVDVSNEYWTSSIGEALSEVGIEATQDQVARLATSVQSISEMEYEYCGHQHRGDPMQKELSETKQELAVTKCDEQRCDQKITS